MRPSATLPERFVERARDFVRQRTGLVFREARWPTFEAALVGAAGRAKESDLDAYLARLVAEPALLDDLVGEITVGETYFFREPQQFDVIRDEVVPALVSSRPRDHPLRIWSAGCATGEEAYTLAILTRGWRLDEGARIVATDLSRTALAVGRRGLYSRWSLRGVSEDVIADYFQRVNERFDLVPALRDAVEFRYLNLAEDAYPSLQTGIWGMDLILCRNVLIYFDAETVAQVARRLIDSLSDDGWLLLGASDPPLGDLVSCDVVVTSAGLAYRRPGRGSGWPKATSVSDPTFAPLPLPPLPAGAAPEAPHPPPATATNGEPFAVRSELEESVDGAAAARAYAERDFERAGELARALVQRDGSDPAPWIIQVRALANRGALEAAGRVCTAALDRHRTSAELNYLHAVLLAEARYYIEAASAARQALYLDRGLVVAHLLLGRALSRLGDIDGALRSLRNAQQVLSGMAPEGLVPATDGEPAGRLAAMTLVHIQLLLKAAA